MRSFIVFFFVSIYIGYSQDSTKLFPVQKNGLYGFINSKGEIKIKPRFRSVGVFKEGRCVARAEGLFGFIDSKGEFVIEPVYDYVEEFNDGAAKVYIEGKPVLINREGEVTLPPIYKRITVIENKQVIALDSLSNYGLVDRNNHILIPFKYDYMEHFYADSFFIGIRREDGKYKEIQEDYRMQYAIVSTSEETLLPFGEIYFEYPRPSKTGKILGEKIVDLMPSYEGESLIVDYKGKVVNVADLLTNKWRPHGFDSSKHSDSSFIFLQREVTKYSLRDFGLLSYSGDLLLKAKNVREIKPLINGIGYYQDDELNSWYMFNDKGEVLNENPYESIIKVYDGVSSIVIQDDKFTVVDDKGGVDFQKNDFKYYVRVYDESEDFLNDSFFSFVYDKNDKYNFGFFNYSNPKYPIVYTDLEYSKSHLFGDLVYYKNPQMECYYNSKGEQIWKSILEDSKVINIDYKKVIKRMFGQPNVIDESLVVPPDTFGLKLVEEVDNYKVILYNTTDLSKDILTSGRTDYVVFQAKNNEGVWCNIECFKQLRDFYGLPVRKVESGKYRFFKSKKFNGGKKMKLRVVLFEEFSLNSAKPKKVISNEIDVYLNPSQLFKMESESIWTMFR